MNCFVVDGKERGEAILKCSLYLEELEDRLQVALSRPHALRRSRAYRQSCYPGVAPALSSQGLLGGRGHALLQRSPTPLLTNCAIPVPQFPDLKNEAMLCLLVGWL